MKDFPDSNRRISQDAPGPFLGKVADADQPFRLKNLHYSTQVAVTSSKKRRDLRAGQSVGSHIPAVLIEERQGTIISDEVVSEKILRRAKSFSRQAPQPSAADFGARARKTFDRTLRMFTARLADRRFDPHPIAHRVDFAKRHTALHHAERAGVHAEEKDTFAAGSVLAEIHLVCAPRVIEWIVNMCGGRGEPQAINGRTEFSCGSDHWGRDRMAGHIVFVIKIALSLKLENQQGKSSPQKTRGRARSSLSLQEGHNRAHQAGTAQVRTG